MLFEDALHRPILLCSVAVAATHGIIYVYAEIYLATTIGLAYSYLTQ